MPLNFTRRAFGRMLGALSGAAVAAPTKLLAEADTQPSASVRVKNGFPADFVWGTATASYQVEGAYKEGGRGPSIWDTFSHTPGKVAHGDTGDVADDFYHRYPQDIALMASLGIRGFRLSVSWPRIFPKGTGAPNPEGVAFYRRLVQELLQHGIEPYVTLYHWDLPQAMQDIGGWENPKVPHYFAEYAGYISEQLSASGVKHFFTTNEIRSFVEIGYSDGVHAPGLKVGRKRLAQLTHHAVLGHGLAVQAIRARAKAGTKVGLAENPTAPVPATYSQADIAAAREAMRQENAAYLTAICEGRYTPEYLQSLGADAPVFTAEEMRIIGSPLDMIGLNIYTPTYVRASAGGKGYEVLPRPEDYPHMASPWLTIGPEAIRWATRLVHELWKPKAIFITENGCSADDKLTAAGEVLDTGRAMYLRNNLSQLQRSVADGVPVRGYFLWSLLDNFEWADGYGKRFGIVYVDFATQKRTPKLSAQMYQTVIAGNGLEL
jgi:beta-glucosidase